MRARVGWMRARELGGCELGGCASWVDELGGWVDACASCGACASWVDACASWVDVDARVGWMRACELGGCVRVGWSWV